jgi:hypothetical protein
VSLRNLEIPRLEREEKRREKRGRDERLALLEGATFFFCFPRSSLSEETQRTLQFVQKKRRREASKRRELFVF